MALKYTNHDGEQEGGEVVKLHPKKPAAYMEAVRDLAAFKFGLYRTIAADPILYGVPCLNFIVVFSDFVSVDKKTLQRTPAYASNATIAARAGLKSHHTAGKARRLLEANGYMVAIGTHNGMTVYRLENPHVERVQMHVRELEEYNREVRADQKQKWNERKKRVAEVAIPENNKGGNNCHPRVAEVAMQGWQDMPSSKLEETLENKLNTGSEGKGSFPYDVEHGICDVGAEDQGGSGEATPKPAPIPPVSNPPSKKNGYATAKNGEFEASEKIDAPFSEQEEDAVLSEVFGVVWDGLHENIRRFARIRLRNGTLSRSWINERVHNFNNPASTGDA